MNNNDPHFNTYGLSTKFLEGLGIQGPLHTKVFVANVSMIETIFLYKKQENYYNCSTLCTEINRNYLWVKNLRWFFKVLCLNLFAIEYWFYKGPC